ncbi:MAG: exodeoxyribonuclease V subunit gamma [Thermodesulfobacteriota bacterium]
MGFNLYTGNRSEHLADYLADIIEKHPIPVFTPETIVVQSRGMARWLTMKLAERLHIWANGDFPFPNQFIIDITRKLIPGQDCISLYEREKAVWQIMTLLAELMDHPLFVPLRSYQTNTLKRYRLAFKIADLFDQYISLQQSHRASLKDNLFACLRHHDVSHLLPARISVFGISYLPPFHLSIFEGLGSQTEINFFLINPCRHWWGHIMDAGGIARQVKKKQKSADELYLEKGNSLLASMGHLGRDFLALLQELETDELEIFDDPGDGTLLAVLQRDILELSESDEASVEVDDSIVVNSCHSPMREVEVLHNHLLKLFENDPDLQPRDIVVMAPDINIYSPLVEAVFGAVHNSERYIPYSIGDQGQHLENPLLPLFLSFLDLAGSRFEVSRILDILYARQVRERFDLSEDDLGVVKGWINRVSIRWGRDKGHLQSLGLPPFDEYCWRSGLDRLLLGVCMSGEGVFKSLAPFVEMEEGDMGLLAKTLEAVTAIFTGVNRLERQQTLVEWAASLEEILDRCFTVNQEEEEYLQAIRNTVREVGRQGGELSFEEELPLEVIRELLERKLGDKTSGSGYLGGGVTFCSLLPMRAVPFKVVCLLGMNDGSFPRAQSRINFDLIAENPRTGDRSRRLDDRYLFLEALVSAREQFYISYVGQSVYDDSDKPVSVLVDEFLDYLARLTAGKQGHRYAADFITRHRLQPFHPGYFQPGGSLYSYSLTDWETARQSLKREDEGHDFNFWQDLPLLPGPELKHKIPERLDALITLTLEELTDFFIHPVRYFCRSRLGIDLRQDDSLARDEEPLKLEGLNYYQLGVELLRSESVQSTNFGTEDLFRARGLLPPGEAGKFALAGLKAEVMEFRRRLQDHESPRLEPLDFKVACGSYHLEGILTELRQNGFIQARPARLKGKDILRAWLRHLILCILAEEDRRLSPASLVIGKDRQVAFARVSGARAILAEILDLYRENNRRPLPFFSETSHIFAREMLFERIDQAWKKAEEEWQGNERIPGEGSDPWLNFRYQQENPLGREFQELALKIFRPIYEHSNAA